MKLLDSDIKAYYNEMISTALQSSMQIKTTKNIFKKIFERINIYRYMNSFISNLKKAYSKDEYNVGDLIQLGSLLYTMNKFENNPEFCKFGNDSWSFSYMLDGETALEISTFHIEREGDRFDVKVDFKSSYRNGSDSNYIQYEVEYTRYNGDQIRAKHDEHTVKSINVSGKNSNMQERMVGKMLGNYIMILVDEMIRYTKEYIKKTYMK